jgi:hypothetical protein
MDETLSTLNGMRHPRGRLREQAGHFIRQPVNPVRTFSPYGMPSNPEVRAHRGQSRSSLRTTVAFLLSAVRPCPCA